MIYFKEYMESVIKEYDLKKKVKNSVIDVKLLTASDNVLHVNYHALQPKHRPTIRAGNFAVPITAAHRQKFFDLILIYNRNALNHLHAGIMPSPRDDRLFHLTWLAPKSKQEFDKWNNDVAVFESLLTVISTTLTEVSQSWMNLKH